ncbi:transporter [Streptomyces chryseus]|nr:transporter [Streptomyces chryseus]
MGTAVSTTSLRLDRNQVFGIWLGAVGVVCFSFTLPATKFAVHEFHPVLVAAGRTVLAFPLAAGFLLLAGGAKPPTTALKKIAILVFGNVVGFPLFTAFALVYGSSANAAVILGLMPLATAVMASFRGGEQPSRAFWACAVGGALAVMTFSVARNGLQLPAPGDVFTLLAVITGSLGYAEGAALTREHGAIRSISWGIVFGMPIALTACIVTSLVTHQQYGSIAVSGATGFLYVALVSSFLAFIPWNIGLAKGGVARVSQVQLLQRLLTLIWAALLLGERISAWAAVVSLIVLLFVFGAARAKPPRTERADR